MKACFSAAWQAVQAAPSPSIRCLKRPWSFFLIAAPTWRDEARGREEAEKAAAKRALRSVHDCSFLIVPPAAPKMSPIASMRSRAMSQSRAPQKPRGSMRMAPRPAAREPSTSTE